MKLRIALSVPNHFAPKARYAIRVLLAPYKIDIEWCELADLSEYGGCYYGPMPIPDNMSEKPIFCINSESKTWEYFESKESYANPTHFLVRDYSGTALPVLFGKEGITSSVANQQCLEADLIASAFYWLSDWQENTRSDRDTHDRLLFKASLQEKMDIGYRAVVDEYGEYLIRFLGLDPEQVRRNKQVRSVFTHDIDRIQKKTAGILVRESLDYLILNRLKKPLSERISRWVQALRQYRGSTDAYQASINRLLEYASKHQLPSTFFLKSILERHLHDGNDYLSTDYFSQIRTALQKQPYEVGYHSGYLAGFKPALLTKEWEQLNQAVGMSVKIHRSHYLRYKPSVTFPALTDLHFQVDSSIAWADHIGFRAQTSQPYPIFDCASNRELPILEIPLSVMDTQYFGYMKLSIDQAIEHIARLLDTIDRHKGVIVWNFHHHIYDPLDAPGWSKVLEFAHERSKHYENTSLSHLYIENQYYYGQ